MHQQHSGSMDGRTVLVTGGHATISRAHNAAESGADLALTGRYPGRTVNAARAIRAGGGRVHVLVADLSCLALARRFPGVEVHIDCRSLALPDLTPVPHRCRTTPWAFASRSTAPAPSRSDTVPDTSPDTPPLCPLGLQRVWLTRGVEWFRPRLRACSRKSRRAAGRAGRRPSRAATTWRRWSHRATAGRG